MCANTPKVTTILTLIMDILTNTQNNNRTTKKATKATPSLEITNACFLISLQEKCSADKMSSKGEGP